MIKHLSTTITGIKSWVRDRTWARLLWYLTVMIALLLFWISFGDAEISFVYNQF